MLMRDEAVDEVKDAAEVRDVVEVKDVLRDEEVVEEEVLLVVDVGTVADVETGVDVDEDLRTPALTSWTKTPFLHCRFGRKPAGVLFQSSDNRIPHFGEDTCS